MKYLRRSQQHARLIRFSEKREGEISPSEETAKAKLAQSIKSCWFDGKNYVRLITLRWVASDRNAFWFR